MNCPHCQKEMPENHGAVYCPLCGKDLPAATTGFAGKKMSWRWFMVALLSPPLLTLISAALMRFVFASQETNEEVSALIGFLGGVIGGIVCGVMIGARASQDFAARIMVSIFCVPVMVIVCITLCCFGCGIGGYQFRIH
jgi:ABC-type nitrate/sulfonate/bicarbonate transport system permease component